MSHKRERENDQQDKPNTTTSTTTTTTTTTPGEPVKDWDDEVLSFEDHFEDDFDSDDGGVEEDSDAVKGGGERVGQGQGGGEVEGGEGNKGGGEGVGQGQGEGNTEGEGKEEEDVENVEDVEEDEDEDEDEEDEKTEVWNPTTQPLKPGEQLEYDNSAYDMIHFVTMEWPCLSFDILPDSLGVQRTNYPHTIYLLAGTQATEDHQNSIILLKLSELNSTKDDDSEDEGFDLEQPEDDRPEGDPVIESRRIPHTIGSINRIRCMPQHPNIIGALSSDRQVNIYDVQQQLSALDRPPHTIPRDPTPLCTFKGHPTEGWAIDWSPRAPGRMISGDCKSFIYLWEPQGANWNVDKVPFTGHDNSVEDVCWSPTEGDVFSTCSVDKTIKLWDIRKGKKPAVSINAHDADVNVLSWNHKRAFLLLSGADDGCFRVWDLRKLGTDTKHQFSFSWHSGAITSVEWNPNDDSELSVASEDNSVTVWDLSLTTEKSKVEGLDIPPQLLFVHRGQVHIKETHWHKQIPGILISIAEDGLNIFKPSNMS